MAFQLLSEHGGAVSGKAQAFVDVVSGVATRIRLTNTTPNQYFVCHAIKPGSQPLLDFHTTVAPGITQNFNIPTAIRSQIPVVQILDDESNPAGWDFPGWELSTTLLGPGVSPTGV